MKYKSNLSQIASEEEEPENDEDTARFEENLTDDQTTVATVAQIQPPSFAVNEESLIKGLNHVFTEFYPKVEASISNMESQFTARSGNEDENGNNDDSNCRNDNNNSDNKNNFNNSNDNNGNNNSIDNNYNNNYNNTNLIEAANVHALTSTYLKTTALYFSHSLRSLSKLGYLLSATLTNLIYRGFCQPEAAPEDGADQGSDDEAKGGTGIGEGQGMENKSKEVQFEEQILGAKGEEKQEQQENKDDKEDAMDMEQEFDGQNVDREKEKDPEAEEDEQEKAEKEANEQFSEVDDQLDYKMWEGQDEQEEAEEEQDRRKQDNFQFKAQKEKGEQQSRAKEQDKQKDQQRNVKEFEDVEEE